MVEYMVLLHDPLVVSTEQGFSDKQAETRGEVSMGSGNGPAEAKRMQQWA